MEQGARKGLFRLFGARLRELRMDKEWTTAQTAARIGITEGYYCKLERGDQGPAFDMLSKLARGFGVDEFDLLVFPGATDRHDLADLLRRAPESVRTRTLAFVRDELARTLLPDGKKSEGGQHHSKRASRWRRVFT